MTLNNCLSSKEAAKLVGVSVPTILRFAGKKRGVDGNLFPTPVKAEGQFNWHNDAINHWVEVNGKQPPTNRGRPKGSTRSKTAQKFQTAESCYTMGEF